MMQPYYEHAGITIFNADCRDVLPGLSGRGNLFLTDPPFFMPATHYQSRVKWQRAWSDTSILGTFWSVILDAAIARLKPTGHLLTFCNGESYSVFYPEMYRRFDALVDLVWDKTQIGLGRMWRHQHELIIAARWETSLFYEDGQMRSDVLPVRATPSQDRNHPVEKPIALLQQLIIPTTKPGDLIIDPFMGGGSTLMAARILGRRAIGIDSEERYCEIAARRLQQEVMQL